VQDGEQALSYLRGEPPYDHCRRPDVVLLDLCLPKLNGHAVLKTIKSDPDLRSIAVVVLTSSEADRDCVAALNLHANGYIVKPVDFARFHEIVERLQLYWSICTYPAACELSI
jgi:CheY-like chemotaxis protein